VFGFDLPTVYDVALVNGPGNAQVPTAVSISSPGPCAHGSRRQVPLFWSGFFVAQVTYVAPALGTAGLPEQCLW
jgi:hypothetical protein